MLGVEFYTNKIPFNFNQAPFHKFKEKCSIKTIKKVKQTHKHTNRKKA